MDLFLEHVNLSVLSILQLFQVRRICSVHIITVSEKVSAIGFRIDVETALRFRFFEDHLFVVYLLFDVALSR
jgi:hypothetical protein